MNDHRLPRREFGRCLAGGVACALPLAAAGGDSQPQRAAAEPPEAGSAPGSAKHEEAEGQPAAPAALSPEEHYLALVQALYPDERLGENELQEVRRQIQAMLGRSRVLAAFPLTNADEPAVSFAAFRPSE